MTTRASDGPSVFQRVRSARYKHQVALAVGLCVTLLAICAVVMRWTLPVSYVAGPSSPPSRTLTMLLTDPPKLVEASLDEPVQLHVKFREYVQEWTWFGTVVRRRVDPYASVHDVSGGLRDGSGKATVLAWLETHRDNQAFAIQAARDSTDPTIRALVVPSTDTRTVFSYVAIRVAISLLVGVLLWLLVAATMIGMFLRWFVPRESMCRACGYNVGGITTGRCPECGKTISVYEWAR